MENNQNNSAEIADIDFEETKRDVRESQIALEPRQPSRVKLQETKEVVIEYGSALTPGNVVLLGTGDINAKYRAWLEKRLHDGLASNDPSKKMTKERLAMHYAVQALCYMAVCEDEATVVTYRWDGPKFTRKHKTLNIPGVIKDFVNAKFDILYAIAPFFGVPNNRVSPSKGTTDVETTTPSVEEVQQETPLGGDPSSAS